MWENGSENINLKGVQRHNYHSDLKWKLYVVTYNKVTSLYREVFFQSWIIQEKTEENGVLYVQKQTILHIFSYFCYFAQNSKVYSPKAT